MAMSSAKRAWYNDRLEKAKLYLELAESGALAQALQDGVEAATFDTGTYGARQHYKTLKMDSMTQYIAYLESHIDWLYRKLGNGGGLVRMRNGRRG